MLACIKIAIVGGVHAQGTNQAQNDVMNPFGLSSLTLTGTVLTAPTMTMGQALAELKQTIQMNLAAEDYQTALNNAMLGLQASPADVQLLQARALALSKLHQLPSAIAALKDVLAVQTNDLNCVDSLAELLLITNRIDEYRTFVLEHKAQIASAYDGALAKYFSVLEAYQTVDTERFHAVVTESLAALGSNAEAPREGTRPTTVRSLLPGWEFGELRYALSKQPDSPKKTALLTFVRVLSGEVSRDAALKAVTAR